MNLENQGKGIFHSTSETLSSKEELLSLKTLSVV